MVFCDYCNYFYTGIRLDVSASELFNIFLAQLASAASFSSSRTDLFDGKPRRQTDTVGPLLSIGRITASGVLVGTCDLPVQGRWQVACLHFPDREGV